MAEPNADNVIAELPWVKAYQATVQKVIDEAVAIEREACAAIADGFREEISPGEAIAWAIRARGWPAKQLT